MMLLHFRLFLPDHLIGYRRKVPLEGCRSIAALRQNLPLQPLVVLEQQGKSLQVCYDKIWTRSTKGY
jgi:hypothetical protein